MNLKSLPLLLCLGLALLLVIYSPLASRGAREGLALCGRVLIPSLYPFFVVGNVYAELGNQKGREKKHLGRVLYCLLRQPPAALGAILLGLLGGYPMGAKMAVGCMEKGALTRAQAQRLQLFCVNAGPAYLLGAVGAELLNSRRAGLLLLVSLTSASLVMAFLSRFYQGAGSRIQDAGEPPAPSLLTPAPSLLTPASYPLTPILSAVSRATAAIIGVCAWVILFSSLCALLRLLPHALWPAIPGLHALLEVSGGAAAMARGGAALPALCAALGWGGLGVHCQILGDLRKTGLPLRIFFVSRLAHGAIAAAFCWQLGRWFPVELSAGAVAAAVQNARLWAVSAPAAAALLFFCAFLILDLDLRRKI